LIFDQILCRNDIRSHEPTKIEFLFGIIWKPEHPAFV